MTNNLTNMRRLSAIFVFGLLCNVAISQDQQEQRFALSDFGYSPSVPCHEQKIDMNSLSNTINGFLGPLHFENANETRQLDELVVIRESGSEAVEVVIRWHWESGGQERYNRVAEYNSVLDDQNCELLQDPTNRNRQQVINFFNRSDEDEIIGSFQDVSTGGGSSGGIVTVSRGKAGGISGDWPPRVQPWSNPDIFLIPDGGLDDGGNWNGNQMVKNERQNDANDDMGAMINAQIKAPAAPNAPTMEGTPRVVTATGMKTPTVDDLKKQIESIGKFTKQGKVELIKLIKKTSKGGD